VAELVTCIPQAQCEISGDSQGNHQQKQPEPDWAARRDDEVKFEP
jgi:hypothetical protein